MVDETVAALHARVVEELRGTPAAESGEAHDVWLAFEALRRIAERHAPMGWAGREVCWCEHCEHSTPWPCADFRDVAAAVGVSVDG